MNFRNKRFYFDLADERDSRELLEIIEESYFEGNISLLYTRRPDPYISLKKEGDNVKIVILRDRSKNKIAGFGVCALRELYINRKEKKVGYLFSLRARKEYIRKVPLLHKGYEFIKNLFPDVRYFYTTILEENIYAKKLLEKKREFMPEYEYLGDYIVYSIRTERKKLKDDFKIKRCDSKDIDDLINFLNSRGRKFQFFPVFKKEKLIEGDFFNLSYRDFYLVYKENKLKAVFSIWDQKSYKQHVVIKYKGILKILCHFTFIFNFLGYPELPPPGKVLNFFHLSFLLIEDNEEDVFDCIINFAKNFKDYSFFVIGFFERDKFNEYIKKYKSIKYKSRVYLVKWRDKEIDFDYNMPLYIECGML